MTAFRSLLEPRALRILSLVGGLLFVFSAVDWWRENEMLGDAREVPAIVVSASLESFTTGTGTARDRQYRPLIRFRYVHDGLERESIRVTPLDRGGSRSWAEETLARHRPGTKTTCWVPNAAGEQAYLLRVRSWKTPVGMVLGLLVALGCGILWYRKREDPTPDL